VPVCDAAHCLPQAGSGVAGGLVLLFMPAGLALTFAEPDRRIARRTDTRQTSGLVFFLPMAFSRKLRLVCWIAGPLFLLLALGLLVFYLALRHVPEFYEEALVVDRARLERASDEMLQRTAALASDLKRDGRWEVLVTQDQLNGFLAVELPRNHPELLPERVSEPRVAIDPEGIRLGCRYRQSDGLESVVWVVVQPYVEQPDQIALRITAAKAGALPVPLAKVTRYLSDAAAREGVHLEWLRMGDDPLARVNLPELEVDGHLVHIDQVRLGQGEIYVSGTSQKRPKNPARAPRRLALPAELP